AEPVDRRVAEELFQPLEHCLTKAPTWRRRMEVVRAWPVRPINPERAASQLVEASTTLSEYGAVNRDEAVGDLLEVVHLFHVRPALLAEPPAQLERLDQRSELLHEIILRRGDDRHLHAEPLLRLSHRVGVEMSHDRLAVRHRLDREYAVPEVVHLVDDDVGALEALDGLVVRDPVHDVEVDRQLLAGLDDEARSFLLEV